MPPGLMQHQYPAEERLLRAEQLSAFGFNITPRSITHTHVGPDIDAGRFQLVIDTWGSASSPHPHYSYVMAFFTYNARTDQPANRGMDFPLVQEWPADDDPILQNSPYADGIPTIQMLTNGLQAVEGGVE